MFSSYFFADPHFLALVEFWEAQRRGRPLPEWDGDVASFPPGLLPNLIISDRRTTATSDPSACAAGAAIRLAARSTATL